VPSVPFYDEIRCTKLNKIVILPYFPFNLKVKLRLEALFKKFNPRINLTSLFFTKLYLLNLIKPFYDHENRFFKTELQNFEYAGHQVGP
jgi:hypothetical protein